MVSPGSRADAATMSRIFDSAVWNCTVSLSRFSVMTSPPRSVRVVVPEASSKLYRRHREQVAGHHPCGDGARNTFARAGSSAIFTTVRLPRRPGVTPRTEPTITPRYLTSELFGRPSPTSDSSAVTGTESVSDPRAFRTVAARIVATSATATSALIASVRVLVPAVPAHMRRSWPTHSTVPRSRCPRTGWWQPDWRRSSPKWPRASHDRPRYRPLRSTAGIEAVVALDH